MGKNIRDDLADIFYKTNIGPAEENEEIGYPRAKYLSGYLEPQCGHSTYEEITKEEERERKIEADESGQDNEYDSASENFEIKKPITTIGLKSNLEPDTKKIRIIESTMLSSPLLV